MFLIVLPTIPVRNLDSPGVWHTWVNFIRSSSLRGCRGLFGVNKGLTSPLENRFAGLMMGDCSADDGIGGVELRYAEV